MTYRITPPDALYALVRLPASKSISNRALILHALSGGRIVPSNLSDCDDTRVMVRALDGPHEVIDILAAGTAMRFLTAYLSVTPGTRLLTGTARMQQRPIRILVDALRSLGAEIAYAGEEGYPPLHITGGRLTGSQVSISGGVSSQYISALLMVGAVLPEGLLLQLTGDIVSRPYIRLTMQLMREYGARTEWIDDQTIRVEPGGYRDVPFLVESDWSAASYWYEILALRGRGEVLLPGLFAHSYQGDSRGAEVFARLGVQTSFTDEGVRLTCGGEPVSCLEEDMVYIPDLAQTFVVTCCLMGIPFRFSGLQSLRIKETDRLSALECELSKLGYVLHTEQDSILWWDGTRCEAEAAPVIATYEDHRMAMAFAPVCLVNREIRIAYPAVVSKSYPRYWDDLRLAGFSVCESDS